MWVVHLEYPGTEGMKTLVFHVPSPTAREAHDMVIAHYRQRVEADGFQIKQVVEEPLEEQQR